MSSYLFTFFSVTLVWCRAVLRRTLFWHTAGTNRLYQQLRLQAALDGELSSRESQRMADVLARDLEAPPLLTELRLVKSALTGNEPQRQLPQSPDFYWGQIKQAIAREEEMQRRRRDRTSNWLWRLAPVTGFVLGLLSLRMIVSDQHPFHDNEVEGTLASVGTLTYRDPPAGLIVVWHYERTSGESPACLTDLEENDGGDEP